MPKTKTAAPVRAGYSGKSVAAKLGLRAGMRVRLASAPDGYWATVEFDPKQVSLARGKADAAHAFFTARAKLAGALPALGAAIAPDGMLWISWPKRASGVATDITEDTIREVALPLGLVDVKVCAFDATWSALKLVWRRERRPGG